MTSHNSFVSRDELDRELAALKERLSEFVAERATYRAMSNHETERAREDMDRRLDSMNQFREQVAEGEKRYQTRAEHEATVARIFAQFANVDQRIDRAAVGLEEKLGTVDLRFRALERQMYMADGAVTVISVLVQFLVRKL